MIKIHFIDDTLILDASSEQSILTGGHRSFFELAAGYDRDLARKRYTLANALALNEVLTDTLEYLADERVPYELDEATRSLLEHIRVSNESYARASVAGLVAKEGSSSTTPIVPNFKRKLKPYQVQSVQHLLVVKNGANFSVPGSGKTAVVLAAYAILRKQGDVEKLMIVGPRSCFMPWEEEYLACFESVPRSGRLTGSKRERYVKYYHSDQYELFLCTYQTAVNDASQLTKLLKRHKVFLVLDESHNIKKFEGGVWADTLLGLSRFASKRAVLTGTPAPNKYEDIWTQFTFLWPDKQVLGSREQFATRCERGEVASIQAAIKPFFMRARKADLHLPPQVFDRVLVEMSPYQDSIYRALSARILSELSLAPEDRSRLRMWRKAKMIRLLQAASNPTLLAKRSEEFDVPPLSGEGVSVLQLLEDYPKYERPAKFDSAATMIRGLISDGHKVVVWTSFVLNIQMLQQELADLEPLILYGAVPRDESENEELNREQQVKYFRQSKRPLVLLANPAACAESISLHQVCRHAIYLDRTFDCGRYMQSLDRIHRIGLEPDQTVTYHILTCINTIDETIDRRLDEKQMVMATLLDDDSVRVGTFESEPHELSASEAEEEVDFDAVINDLQRHQAQPVN